MSNKLHQIDRADKRTLIAAIKQHTQQHTTAVCNITGIRFTIEAPTIKHPKGYVFEYQNPLALFSNASFFAKQDNRQLIQQDNTILAGCLLTLFHYRNLKRDKLSALEANLYLSQCNKNTLIYALRFTANLSDYECRRIPQISLFEADPNTLNHWLSDCQIKLQAKPEEVFETLAKKVHVDSKSKAIVPVEVRKSARLLLNELKELKLVSGQFASILTFVTQGSNLATIELTLRNKLILGLDKLEHKTASKLAILIKTAGEKMNMYAQNLNKELEEASISSTVGVQTPLNKLSLAEIIARRLAGESITNTTSSSAEADIEAEFSAKQQSRDLQKQNLQTAKQQAAKQSIQELRKDIKEDLKAAYQDYLNEKAILSDDLEAEDITPTDEFLSSGFLDEGN